MFGDGKDRELADRPGYRTVNQACAQMDLASAEFSVSQVRGILHCFNSNGALSEIEKLSNKLTDAQLKPVVKIANQVVFKNPKLLYQFEQTYNTLKDQGRLGPVLFETGRLLENSDLVASLFALMRGGDPQLPMAVHLLAQKAGEAGVVSDALDAALILSRSRAFISLERHLRGPSPDGRSLDAVAGEIIRYLKESSDSQRFQGGRELSKTIADGRIFKTFDEVYTIRSKELMGTQSVNGVDLLKIGSPYVSLMLKGLLGGTGNGADFSQTLGLFHYMHRPITCLKSQISVQDGIEVFVKELISRSAADVPGFIIRDYPLLVKSMSPFCDFPPELGKYYPELTRLASTTAIQAHSDFLKAIYHNDLLPFISDLFADSLRPGTLETVGVGHLVPVLAEINDRAAWEDIILLLNLPTDENRKEISSFFSFLIAGRAELQGRSIYDVLASTLSHADQSDLARVITSAQNFMEKDEPILFPSLSMLRTAFYLNDVHPVIDALQGSLAIADQNPELLDTIFAAVALPEFRDSVAQLSDMAKDGRLRDLLDGGVTIFHKFALAGSSGEIHPALEPSLADAKHDLNYLDLTLLNPLPLNLPAGDAACFKIDPSIPMDNYLSPAFATQLFAVTGCLNVDQQHQDVVNLIQYYSDQKADAGESYLNYTIDFLKSANLDGPALGDLVQRWITGFDSGGFFQGLDALPYWFSKPIKGDATDPGGPALRPLMDLAGPLLQKARANFRGLETYAGKVLLRPDLPVILKYLESIFKLTPEPVMPTDAVNIDPAKIMLKVRNHECELAPEKQSERAKQVIDDYLNQLTNEGRTTWSLEDFNTEFKPFLDKFADDSQSAPDKPLLTALLESFGYFTLPDGAAKNKFQHYPPDVLRKWLADRSNDFKTILYIYPGETKPRVKLVNSLDRLELLLINADFSYSVPYNFVQSFLQGIALAWGDEPIANWPDLIKATFPVGPHAKKPRNLSQAVTDIANFEIWANGAIGPPDGLPICDQVADPDEPPPVPVVPSPNGPNPIPIIVPGNPAEVAPPDVKARMFNIHQVVSVLSEDLPGTGRGGMEILRDLLFELYASTPVVSRNSDPKTGWNNNLAVAVKIARMGGLRQISRQMRRVAVDPGNASATQDFFASFVQSAASCSPICTFPALSALSRVLKEDRDHLLINKTIEQLFAISALPADALALRQLLFYVVANVGPLNLSGAVLKTLDVIPAQHRDFLVAHPEYIGNFLRSHKLALAARALYEDQDLVSKKTLGTLLQDTLDDPSVAADALAVLEAIVGDDKAFRGWNLFWNRSETVLAMPEYKNLKTGDLLTEALHFFEEVPAPGQPQAALEIRQFLAAHLNDAADPNQLFVEQYLALAARDPDRFYALPFVFGEYIENGQLKDFLGMMRRSVGAH